MKIGFSLAETLITLVIIGIVAAMKFPSIILYYLRAALMAVLKEK